MAGRCQRGCFFVFIRQRGRLSCAKVREAVTIFKWFFGKKKRNEQPENVRIAHRAVKLAKLTETYHISLSDKDAAELVGEIADIPDRELDYIGAGASVIVGCPAGIIPLFAGYGGHCAACPYYTRNPAGNQHDCCALIET